MFEFGYKDMNLFIVFNKGTKFKTRTEFIKIND